MDLSFYCILRFSVMFWRKCTLNLFCGNKMYSNENLLCWRLFKCQLPWKIKSHVEICSKREMLTTKTFIKKTKKGSIIKIVREHYLRDDITCGTLSCTVCDPHETKPLEKRPANKSKLCRKPHLLILDTNVVFHQVRNLSNLQLYK